MQELEVKNSDFSFVKNIFFHKDSLLSEKKRKKSFVKDTLLSTKLFSFQFHEVCSAGVTVEQYFSSYSRCPPHDRSAISKPLTKN